MEMPSGADEGHAAVTRRAVDRHAVSDKSAAGVVDVVHGVCEMAEITAAGVGLGIPSVGEFHGSRLVAEGGEEHVGVAAFLDGGGSRAAPAPRRRRWCPPAN